MDQNTYFAKDTTLKSRDMTDLNPDAGVDVNALPAN